MAKSFAPGCQEVVTTMKIALLGTGFGQAHAAVYAQRPDVDDVVLFGRTPEKLAKIGGEFGFATSTDLDGLLADSSVDLVDICLPTRLHADVAIRAMEAGKHVLIELPLAAALADARRIITAHKATGQMAFVDMFSRFSPANQHLREAIADQRYGPLQMLEIEGRTALLWPGYDLGLDTLALDMMHADFDLVTSLLGPARHRARGWRRRAGRSRLGRGGDPRLPARHLPVHQFIADANALRNARRLARHLHQQRARIRHACRVHRPGVGHPHRAHQRQREIHRPAGRQPL
jgi:predicted dehydrogenase